jgi:hypothetical protein
MACTPTPPRSRRFWKMYGAWLRRCGLDLGVSLVNIEKNINRTYAKVFQQGKAPKTVH